MESPQTRVVDPEIVKGEIVAIAGDALARVRAIRITSYADRDLAAVLGAEIKTREDRLLEKKQDVVVPARKLYEKLRDMFDEDIKPFAKARQTLSALISGFDVEQERLAALERERQEKDRREREAESARLRLLQEIEDAHVTSKIYDQEWEIAQADERARKDRERKLAEEQDARLKQAQVAEDLGMRDRVGQILDNPTPISQATPEQAPAAPAVAALPAPETPRQAPPEAVPEPAKAPQDAPLIPAAVVPPPPVLAPAPPPPAKAASPYTVSRDEWRVECTDPRALAQAILDGKADESFMDFVFKGAPVRAEVVRLGSLFKCPGVRVWKERRTDFKRQD